MLTQVQLQSSQGSLLTLSLSNPGSLIVKDIQGLDPVKATLVSSSFAGLDGEQYHSARREARNIVITLGLDPDFVDFFSAEELRDQLYDYVLPKSEVKLIFFRTGKPNVEIVGIVEDMPTPLFAKEPAVDISIMCFDPDFVDPNVVLLNGMTTAGDTPTTVTYSGTVETGIRFTLNLDRDLSEFTIYHTTPGGVLSQLDFAAPMLAGDILNINTIRGEKGSYLTRSGANSSTLYGVQPQSKWIELVRGPNLIRVYAEGDPIPYTLEYITRLGGL